MSCLRDEPDETLVLKMSFIGNVPTIGGIFYILLSHLKKEYDVTNSKYYINY